MSESPAADVNAVPATTGNRASSVATAAADSSPLPKGL
jgi:hypothetical protein